MILFSTEGWTTNYARTAIRTTTVQSVTCTVYHRMTALGTTDVTRHQDRKSVWKVRIYKVMEELNVVISLQTMK